MKKVISKIFVLIILIGIGYAVYVNSGPIVHESLILKGETLRIGNMTQRKVAEYQREHEVTLPEGAYIVLLEGYFPDPSKRINASNQYDIKITDSSGAEILSKNVRFKFSNKEKKEGSKQLMSDLLPGKTIQRVVSLDSSIDRNLTLTIIRKECDTVANELFLKIRKKRG